MALSVRSRFIIISLSIAIPALVLFTSVMYDRAIQYKHKQESDSNSILYGQLFNLVSNIEDPEQLKLALTETFQLKNQPAVVFSIVDSDYSKRFYLQKDNFISSVFDNLVAEIKTDNKSKGRIRYDEVHYIWHITDLPKNKNQLLIIYKLSSPVLSDYIKFFGLPFFISGFILCWAMVWASIILSSLVLKLENQKQILSEQAADIEKARDEALLANSAKSHFLANMSHEIRTPLTSIIGFAESCMDKDQTKEEKSRATKTIIKSGNHLLNIINEILDLSKIEAGKLDMEYKPVSIIELLNEIKQLIKIMADEKSLIFSINFIYPIPEKIISDSLRLKQILINLCSNAVKFTGEGEVNLNVSFNATNSVLQFDVIDTGIGMSGKVKEKIFNPFEQADSSTTRKFGGTGLGLTLSQQLTEMLGGKLTVNSKPGSGSQFTVSLKIKEPDNSRYIYEVNSKDSFSDDDIKNIAVPKLQGKVLVAEDNIDIQELIKFTLRKTGLDIRIVDNGKQAIKEINETDFDLVFLDIQMPVMDGVMTMMELKKRKYAKPVIVMTANAMQDDREECEKAGFADFISKPIDRNKLYSVLQNFLKSNNVERENTLITSNLLTEEPDLIDLIDKFITRVPIIRDEVNQAYKSNDFKELERIIHQLKGVGGGYGYPMLTELCADVEENIKSEDVEKVATLINELNLMVDEIISGKKENHRIASVNI